jgi:hypothetical protein
VLGIGIPPGETYEFMIPGSQFNINNLACIVVTLGIFYNATSQARPRWHKGLLNLALILILTITFSRLAFVLYIVDGVRRLRLRNLRLILPIAALIAGGIGFVNSVDYVGNETVDFALYKAKSLTAIAEVGLAADSSTSSRTESYINFIQKIDQLGLGSAEILNYSRFTADALFDDPTLYINPHSMIIEMGYWMGWPGLIALSLFLGIAYGRPQQGSVAERGFTLVAVLVVSTIPSSAIPLPSLWLGMLMLAMLGSFRRTTEASSAHLTG